MTRIYFQRGLPFHTCNGNAEKGLAKDNPADSVDSTFTDDITALKVNKDNGGARPDVRGLGHAW